MKQAVFFACTLLSTSLAFANISTCRTAADAQVVLSLKITPKEISAQIQDPSEFLGIRDLKPTTTLNLDLMERKREAKYTFTKFYGEINAWQDVSLSIPKTITSKTFPAYLTVYLDNGDFMAAGEAIPFFCK